MTKARPEKPSAVTRRVDARLKDAFEQIERSPTPQSLTGHLDKLTRARKNHRS